MKVLDADGHIIETAEELRNAARFNGLSLG